MALKKSKKVKKRREEEEDDEPAAVDKERDEEEDEEERPAKKAKKRAADDDDDDGSEIKLGKTNIGKTVAESEKSGSTGGDFMTLEEGDTYLRFMPPRPGKDEPWLTYFRHEWRGQEWGNVTCPAQTPHIGKRCPICEHYEKVAASEGKRAAKPFRATLRCIAPVVDMTDKKAMKLGVQLLAFSWMIYSKLSKMLKSSRTGDFTDEENGLQILINREGTDRDTTYETSATPQVAPLKREWKKALVDLNLEQFAQAPSKEEMEGCMRKLGILRRAKRQDDDDEEDEDDRAAKKPRRDRDDDRRSSKKSKKAKRRVEDDIDEDEEEEEEDD